MIPSAARVAAMWLVSRAQGHAILTKDYHLIHEDKGLYQRIWLVHRDDRAQELAVVGDIIFRWEAACDGYSVKEVVAQHGLGPLLYDAAMEAVYPKYLGPDKPLSVSAAAARVWKYYDTNRSDVDKKPRVDPRPPPPAITKVETDRVLDSLLEGRLDLDRWVTSLKGLPRDQQASAKATFLRFLENEDEDEDESAALHNRYHLQQHVLNTLNYNQALLQQEIDQAGGSCPDHHIPYLNQLFRKRPGRIKQHLTALREFNHDPRIIATFGRPLDVTDPKQLKNVSPEFQTHLG